MEIRLLFKCKETEMKMKYYGLSLSNDQRKSVNRLTFQKYQRFAYRQNIC